MDKVKLIESMAEAIKAERRTMYDTVVECTGNPPSSGSAFLDRDLRRDIAKRFAEKALKAICKELPSIKENQHNDGYFYNQLKQWGNDE